MKGHFEGTFWTTSSWTDDLKKPLGIVGAILAAMYWLGIVPVLVILIVGLVAVLAFLLRREIRASRAARADAEAERQLSAPRSLTLINVQPGAHVHLAAAESAPEASRPALAQSAAPRRGARLYRTLEAMRAGANDGRHG